ncbi:MAG: DUF4494 domain-containing protein [Duncaniella sp.]|nr:DUF4494 domain-containing protein [Duncaniella sp.]MDE6391439.1 DUF4494 domain-containing protein [Duncaniella sp.]
MSIWFETKVRYDKTMENGAIKKVTEAYMVDALSFTEAEARISEEIAHFTSDYTISAVKITKISEIFNHYEGERWYLVKAAFITLDEKTAVEKKSITQFLVSADSFKEAYDHFMEGMKGTMADFEINTIQETAIMDVYTANLAAKKATEE